MRGKKAKCLKCGSTKLVTRVHRETKYYLWYQINCHCEDKKPFAERYYGTYFTLQQIIIPIKKQVLRGEIKIITFGSSSTERLEDEPKDIMERRLKDEGEVSINSLLEIPNKAGLECPNCVQKYKEYMRDDYDVFGKELIKMESGNIKDETQTICEICDDTLKFIS